MLFDDLLALSAFFQSFAVYLTKEQLQSEMIPLLKSIVDDPGDAIRTTLSPLLASFCRSFSDGEIFNRSFSMFFVCLFALIIVAPAFVVLHRGLQGGDATSDRK